MTQFEENQRCQGVSLPFEAPPQDVLDHALDEILGKGNPYSYSVLTALERSLRQHRLSPLIEAYEILNEAYLRGKKQLQAGLTIYNPHAWLKYTGFNVIRERRRKQRARATDPGIVAALVSDQRPTPVQNSILEAEIEALHQAMEQLRDEEPEAAELLYLRTVEGWSWRQIRQWLLTQGREAPHEATLRQRGSRAKKRLRSIFHQVMD